MVTADCGVQLALPWQIWQCSTLHCRVAVREEWSTHPMLPMDSHRPRPDGSRSR